MRVLDLLNNKLLDLPKVQLARTNYNNFLKNVLLEYGDLIENLDKIDFKGIEDSEGFKNYNQKLIKGIIAAVDYYYDGKPFKAYSEIHEILGDYKKYPRLKQIEFNCLDNFFRVRIKEENYGLTPKDLFHIPFEKRGIVQTQRYSIPGFPSLYLSNSIYVCWEELGRPEINKVHVARFTPKQTLNFLDFKKPDLYRTIYSTPEKIDRKLFDYLMTWPLIASCSIKVNNREDVFKPEYIIPQLLLQWVRENHNVDGICYFSTNVDGKVGIKGEFYNLVLPVKESENKGYCKTLMKKLTMTNVISKPIIDIMEGNNGGYSFYSHEYDEINSSVKQLQLITGRSFSYGTSVFGKLEQYLKVEQPSDIKF